MYKRQVPSCEKANKTILFRVFLICHFDCNRKNVGPVSYTHLDVYKRQVRALGLDDALFSSVGTEQDGSATVITAQQSGHYYAYVNDSKVDTLKMELSLIHI